MSSFTLSGLLESSYKGIQGVQGVQGLFGSGEGEFIEGAQGIQGIQGLAGSGTAGSSESFFETRQDLVQWKQAGNTLDNGSVVFAEGILYEYQSGADVLPTLQDFIPHKSPDIRHFGGVGDGIVDDTEAIQSLINYLASDPNPSAPLSAQSTTDTALSQIREGSFREVNLHGGNYLISSPIYVGKFDFDQDGVFEHGCGPIYGVNFRNGRFTADPEGLWDIKISNDDIHNFMFYIGVVASSNYDGIIDPVSGQAIDGGSKNTFHVGRIEFNDVELNGSFVTGGIYLENTARTHVKNCHIHNMGPGCFGVDTGTQSSANSRGVSSKNQETVIDGTRFEGNYRIDGTNDWPEGMSEFEDDTFLFKRQLPVDGNLTLDGDGIQNGEWVSASGIPFYVMIKNAFYASIPSGTELTDLSGVTFTVTGFADTARTQPITEQIKGPIGGVRPRFSYGKQRFAVITSISSDTDITDSFGEITATTSFSNTALRVRSHDFYISNCIMTAFPVAIDIVGRAGQVYGNHPWSRQVILRKNARKINFFGNYWDFTDVFVYAGSSRVIHQFTSNSWQIGNCDLIIVTDIPNTSMSDLLVVGNIFTERSGIRYRTEGSGSFTEPSLATIVGNTFHQDSFSNYNNFSGYSAFSGTGPNGTAIELFGTLNMGLNRIKNVEIPENSTDAATKGYVDQSINSTLENLNNNIQGKLITQEDYDALTELEPNILYVIIED